MSAGLPVRSRSVPTDCGRYHTEVRVCAVALTLASALVLFAQTESSPFDSRVVVTVGSERYIVRVRNMNTVPITAFMASIRGFDQAGQLYTHGERFVDLFEDGSWTGDGDYVARILKRRRAASEMSWTASTPISKPLWTPRKNSHMRNCETRPVMMNVAPWSQQ